MLLNSPIILFRKSFKIHLLFSKLFPNSHTGKNQISWSDKLQKKSRKFRVNFPGQKLLYQITFHVTRKHDISCTFPVMSEISHFMYNSKQGHMKFPIHFLRYQKFDVSCTFPRSRTHDIYCTFPVHILQHQKFYISCTFTTQEHKTFPAYFL